MKTKERSRLWLPKGYKRAEIISKTRDDPIREHEYDTILEEDFNANRAQYREVIIHGVPVKVKVQKVS